MSWSGVVKVSSVGALMGIALSLNCSGVGRPPAARIGSLGKHCDDDILFELTALQLALPVDAVELVYVDGLGCEHVVGRKGVMCQQSDAAAACDATVLSEGAASGGPAPAQAESMYFRTRERATVRVWRGEPRVRELMGPIDSEAKAWMMLSVHRALPLRRCQGSENEGCAAPTPGGFEISLRHYTHGCRPMVYQDVSYVIARDGSITERPGETQSYPDRCAD
jgi:hypothetical protein